MLPIRFPLTRSMRRRVQISAHINGIAASHLIIEDHVVSHALGLDARRATEIPAGGCELQIGY